MEARIISDRQQWNDFVAASVCCNITQSYEWGQLAPHLGAEALYTGVVDDQGQLCAAMLVLVSRLPVLGTYFYAPRGPVIDDPSSPALGQLLDFVRQEARRRGAFMLKVEPSVPDGDERWLAALRSHGFRRTPYAMHIRHEWVLDIRPDEQALLANMKEKWRYNIRLAARKGVSVRRGEGPADLDTFYRLYRITSERDRFFIHEKPHYEDILRLYSEGDRAALFLAEYEGQAIAGLIALRFGRWSWYMYGASSNEHRNRMPNHLLQWTAIRWAKEHGCWYYNFRGIPDILEEGQELWGVYVFKQGFGGYPLRFLETHDLAYKPLVYQTYRRLLDLKRWRDQQQRSRLERQQQTQPTASAREQSAREQRSAGAGAKQEEVALPGLSQQG
ncbi:lipid II:glycine glycyltransferase FemX [Thermogemmatispora onikobensis]|uniref:lipid II:glycine glycyltransferase FemX n=1 Tax=Thermogemmatispora onikobensis TaxID=732234 RepID=UPI000852D934|nr:peptidoglycan bridge formation glycyltransferase FemA/FemB family protein [Thermogemmatispora onikobensis]